MRLKLVMALLALGMATVTFTSCGDDTPDNGLELTSYLMVIIRLPTILVSCRQPLMGRRSQKGLQSPFKPRTCRLGTWS